MPNQTVDESPTIRWSRERFPVYTIRQELDSTSIADSYEETRREMSRLSFSFQPGQSVAITASSRGITDILPITRGVVDHFKELGLVPFVVPAMGSHAGGTAESQKQLLAGYGLTESSLGCPIRSGMETKVFGTLEIRGDDGRLIPCPVHVDRFAAEADHLFLINRIKSHTRFTGPIESGLLKMLMIGLGNAEGASIYHRAVSDDRFPAVIQLVAEYLVDRVPLIGGLGIVENGFGKTAMVRAIPSDKLLTEEPRLLELSKRLMPRLPFEEIDLLFIRQIGKNISGTGLDSNVVGRKFDDHKAVRGEKPIVRCIAVCGLTPETDGNANGIGMAEFCLRQVLREIDVKKTRFNAMTANHVSAAMIPLDFETEEEILDAAWLTIGRPDPLAFRVAWIQNTLDLEKITVSGALWNDFVARKT